VAWGRVLAGSVVVVLLLALGSLEVFSGRVRVDPSSPLTVLEVDKDARRLLSVNGLGRVRVAEVSNEAVVVTEDKKAADLALLTVGDLIRVESSNGRIQRIVVLRHAWHETESPEQ